MTDTVAYALREEFAGTVTQTIDGDEREVPRFSGGLIAAGEDEVDLAKALEEGNGAIVVDPSANPLLVAVLDEVPVLKRVPAEAAAEAATIGYADQSATRLRAEAGRRGIAGAGGASKAELVPALEADDARIAAGDPQPDDYSVAGLTATAHADTPEA